MVIGGDGGALANGGEGEGGGLFSEVGATMTVTNCTIADNEGTGGHGGAEVGGQLRELGREAGPPDDGEGRDEVTLVPSALAGRDDVGDCREGDDEDCPAADALDRSRQHELNERLGDAGEYGSRKEDRDSDLEQPTAAVEIAQLPGDRHRCGRREEVDRGHPRDVVERLEVAHDGWERG